MSNLKIFFATDIHGSETCFRKFLSAAKVYQADVLIMGGDITGKMIVPIVETAKNQLSFVWLGASHSVSADEVTYYEQQIRMSGCYPYRTTPDEMKLLEEDKEALKSVFRKTMLESLKSWLALAEERLDGTGVECYISPGNDDDLELDKAFMGLSRVCFPENRLVRIAGEYEMISTGYSNITPWNSPRELEEDQLAAKIEGMASQLRDPQRAIFNFHCPPYGIGLDIAPRLDANLKPVVSIGGVETIPVGSKAVINAIRSYRPMLGLHGHVHEARGVIKVGRTYCVNPGSEYTEGILRGCLILLDKKGVRDYMLTSG